MTLQSIRYSIMQQKMSAESVQSPHSLRAVSAAEIVANISAGVQDAVWQMYPLTKLPNCNCSKKYL